MPTPAMLPDDRTGWTLADTCGAVTSTDDVTTAFDPAVPAAEAV